MLFFPYRVDVQLRRFPFITIAICLLCIWIFVQQLSSYEDYRTSITDFCQQKVDRTTLVALRHITNNTHGYPCVETYLSIRESENAKRKITDLVEKAKPLNLFKSAHEDKRYLIDTIHRGYTKFESAVPKNLTDELQYNPTELKIKRMVTSSFTHGSWGHLIFNLLFFYAFAASVEVITGSLVFSIIIFTMSVSTSLAYSYSIASSSTALPTIGLSGIVMGMVALLAVMSPTIRIRCFFWFLIFIRRFSLPALFLAAWYVGWDIYNLVENDANSNINFTAHVSGAVTGIIIGLGYWLFKPNKMKSLR